MLKNHKLFRLLAPAALAIYVFLFGGYIAAQTVTIYSPANGESVPTSVPIHAITDTAADRMEVWVDSVKVAQQNGTSFVGHVTVSGSGTHRFVIVAAQGTNTVLAETVESIDVNTAPTVLSGLDDLFDDNSNDISTNGCTNGAPTTFSVSHVGNPSPNLDGSSAKFLVSQSGAGSYNCMYWLVRNALPGSVVQYVKYHFHIYIPSQPSGDSKQPLQAFEFEVQQRFNNVTYNMAWQVPYRGCSTSCQWRIYDINAPGWMDSGISFTPLSTDAWHEITAEFHIQNGVVYHDLLTVDGSISAPTQNFSHAGKSKTSADQLTNAFQIDMDQYDDDFTNYIDEMDVTYTP